jgi:hypothetical protein
VRDGHDHRLAAVPRVSYFRDIALGTCLCVRACVCCLWKDRSRKQREEGRKIGKIGPQNGRSAAIDPDVTSSTDMKQRYRVPYSKTSRRGSQITALASQRSLC